MSYSLWIQPEYGLARVKLAGNVTGSTLVRALDAILRDEGWVAEYNVLWDARSIRMCWL